ncbi:MAG: phosphoribosylformylglycinamidine cyclo-ligase [Chlamydiae bacterium CG10_big_fil_rev_8_21_14_0_10_35_9]|nr:MAG: phosphoribosylformylglycinamidine cyclo-ligase [Chlamydiae bacterium CG10_big_fil_rev_8_21_14_0_10_35_9]
MLTYQKAGVDTAVARKFVEAIKEKCPDIGGFSGLYPLGNQFLAASTDGVGTKLKLAFDLNIHNTIGIDLVAMCVNDILTCGAKPLFFLDYFATSKLDLDVSKKVMEGILKGCELANCALIGGETAEMPGFYQEKEYDLSGFAVGIIDKDKVIDGKAVEKNDCLVGIASSGVHSNGFSLIRKILDVKTGSLNTPFQNTTLGKALLTPTTIYTSHVQDLLKKHSIKAMAHITGGGLQENIERVIPNYLSIEYELPSTPAIFQWIQDMGNIGLQEMLSTFNMGIGFVLIVDEQTAEKICQASSDYFLFGKVIKKS